MFDFRGLAIDKSSGEIHHPGVISSTRKVADLASYFRGEAAGDEREIYTTYTLREPDDEGLLTATTRLMPGSVGEEAFMTRGHFHVDPTLGEEMLVISGKGELWLRPRGGATQVITLGPGDSYDIPGTLAHRAVNPGPEPFVFVVRWDDACGHDYDTILAEGFPTP